MTLDPAIGWSIRLTLGLLLGFAALHKVADLARFRSVLANYRMLPAAFVPLAVPLVIAAELGAAVLLVIAPLRPAGALLAAGLLVAYGVALGINLLRGRTRIDCGCLGFGRSERISWWMVGRNLGLAAVGLVTTLPPSGRDVVPLDLLTIGGAVVTVGVLYAALGSLLAMPLRRGGAS